MIYVDHYKLMKTINELCFEKFVIFCILLWLCVLSFTFDEFQDTFVSLCILGYIVCEFLVTLVTLCIFELAFCASLDTLVTLCILGFAVCEFMDIVVTLCIFFFIVCESLTTHKLGFVICEFMDIVVTLCIFFFIVQVNFLILLWIYAYLGLQVVSFYVLLWLFVYSTSTMILVRTNREIVLKLREMGCALYGSLQTIEDCQSVHV